MRVSLLREKGMGSRDKIGRTPPSSVMRWIWSKGNTPLSGPDQGRESLLLDRPVHVLVSRSGMAHVEILRETKKRCGIPCTVLTKESTPWRR